MHVSYREFFKNIDAGLPAGARFLAPPTVQPGVVPTTGAVASDPDAARVAALVRAFQTFGFEAAATDPLQLTTAPKSPMELDPASYGFSSSDLARTVTVPAIPGEVGLLGSGTSMPLGQLIDMLRARYCGTLSFEFTHLRSLEERRFLVSWAESPENNAGWEQTPEGRMRLLRSLINTRSFEEYLRIKHQTLKRFGVEGCDAMVPLIEAMLGEATRMGAEHAVIGMPHRGRLAVLKEVMQKPMEVIALEF